MHKCTVAALENSKSGSVRGYQKHHFEPFLPNFEVFFFFFSFLHWNHVIFGLQLGQSILVHMCTVVALEKFKIRICQGVPGGTKTPFLAIFAYFLDFFVFFFSFLHYHLHHHHYSHRYLVPVECP